jgi:hypothetical protein
MEIHVFLICHLTVTSTGNLNKETFTNIRPISTQMYCKSYVFHIHILFQIQQTKLPAGQVFLDW